MADINEFYGKNFLPFVGIVKELNPDNLRARVRIFGIHDIEDSINVSNGDLPWAVIGYSTDSQTPHSLVVNSWVYGVFVDGRNAQQPVILNQFGIGHPPSGDGSYSSGGDIFSGRALKDSEIPSDTNIPQKTKTLNIPGGSMLEKSYNYIYNKLVALNMSSNPHLHTSAFTGVLMTETYGVTFVGGASDDLYTGGGGGYKGRAWGICQWLGSRRSTFFNRYGQSTDLGDQLDFMWWELMNTESRARSRWLSANNLEDATAGASSFERNDCWDGKRGRINRSHPIFIKTYQHALQVYNTLNPTAYEPEKSKRTGLQR